MFWNHYTIYCREYRAVAWGFRLGDWGKNFTKFEKFRGTPPPPPPPCKVTALGVACNIAILTDVTHCSVGLVRSCPNNVYKSDAYYFLGALADAQNYIYDFIARWPCPQGPCALSIYVLALHGYKLYPSFNLASRYIFCTDWNWNKKRFNVLLNLCNLCNTYMLIDMLPFDYCECWRYQGSYTGMYRCTGNKIMQSDAK